MARWVRKAAHNFKVVRNKRRQLSWPVCIRCGLISLRNAATARMVRLGCGYWEDDPDD